MRNPLAPLLQWLRGSAEPKIEKDTSMDAFKIIYPCPYDLVRYHQSVVMVNVPEFYCTPQVYVLANDNFWHRQERAGMWDAEKGLWVADCYFGEEFNRSGWNYKVVAIISIEALPPTMDTLPEVPVSCITAIVPVTRR